MIRILSELSVIECDVKQPGAGEALFYLLSDSDEMKRQIQKSHSEFRRRIAYIYIFFSQSLNFWFIAIIFLLLLINYLYINYNAFKNNSLMRKENPKETTSSYSFNYLCVKN